MYEKRLKGVVIPMITPMNEDSSVDDASLRNFVNTGDLLEQVFFNLCQFSHFFHPPYSGIRSSNRAVEATLLLYCLQLYLWMDLEKDLASLEIKVGGHQLLSPHLLAANHEFY